MNTYLLFSDNSTIKLITTPNEQSTNEKTENYTFPKTKNYIPSKSIKSICKKLDFSNIENISLNKISKNNNDEIYSDGLMETENGKNNNHLNTEHSLYLVHLKFDEEYIILKTLANGEMGKNFLCLKSKDKKIFVVKQCSYSTSTINDFYKLENLIKIISKNNENVFYPYINKYLDCWMENNFGALDENDIYINKNYNIYKSNIYISSNYCCFGNLNNFLSKINSNNKNIDFYWDIFFEMMISIQFLHELGYVHMDIKPNNYLVNENGEILLNDFSLSIQEKDININTFDFDGDSIYISPELFYKNFEQISHKTDIFSLGLSIFEILTGFNFPKNGELWQNIRKNGIPDELFNLINKFDNKSNEIFITLIKNLTNINSNLRPDIINILSDEDNYPMLYQRYKLLKVNLYIESYSHLIRGIKYEKYDFSNRNTSLSELFVKKSDSVKSIINV